MKFKDESEYVQCPNCLTKISADSVERIGKYDRYYCPKCKKYFQFERLSKEEKEDIELSSGLGVFEWWK